MSNSKKHHLVGAKIHRGGTCWYTVSDTECSDGDLRIHCRVAHTGSRYSATFIQNKLKHGQWTFADDSPVKTLEPVKNSNPYLEKNKNLAQLGLTEDTLFEVGGGIYHWEEGTILRVHADDSTSSPALIANSEPKNSSSWYFMALHRLRLHVPVEAAKEFNCFSDMGLPVDTIFTCNSGITYLTPDTKLVLQEDDGTKLPKFKQVGTDGIDTEHYWFINVEDLIVYTETVPTFDGANSFSDLGVPKDTKFVIANETCSLAEGTVVVLGTNDDESSCPEFKCVDSGKTCYAVVSEDLELYIEPETSEEPTVPAVENGRYDFESKRWQLDSWAESDSNRHDVYFEVHQGTERNTFFKSYSDVYKDSLPIYKLDEIQRYTRNGAWVEYIEPVSIAAPPPSPEPTESVHECSKVNPFKAGDTVECINIDFIANDVIGCTEDDGTRKSNMAIRAKLKLGQVITLISNKQPDDQIRLNDGACMSPDRFKLVTSDKKIVASDFLGMPTMPTIIDTDLSVIETRISAQMLVAGTITGGFPTETEETITGENPMSQLINVNVPTTPFAKTTVTTIFGADITRFNESELRSTLQRIAKAKADMKALELGKVTTGSYQDRELKALDAARVAVIDALNALEAE